MVLFEIMGKIFYLIFHLEISNKDLSKQPMEILYNDSGLHKTLFKLISRVSGDWRKPIGVLVPREKKQANVMPIMDVHLHILNSYRERTCQTFKWLTSLFQLP